MAYLLVILGQWVCQLFIAVTKRIDKNNLKGKKYILAQGFIDSVHGYPGCTAMGPRQGKTSWMKGMAEEKCSTHDSQEAEKA